MFETRGFWAETATATPSSRINFFMLLVSCRTRLEVSTALRRDSTTETTRFPITSKRCKEIPVLRKQWQSKQKQKQQGDPKRTKNVARVLLPERASPVLERWARKD